jgi:hypothetical protein
MRALLHWQIVKRTVGLKNPEEAVELSIHEEDRVLGHMDLGPQ